MGRSAQERGGTLSRMRTLLLVLLSTVALAAGQEPGTVTLENGVIVTTLKEGKGENPKASDTVKVNYRGSFTDGREFDSSYKRKEPTTFKLSSVIPCWTEGVQKMKVGGKAKLMCPPATAYAERGAGSVVPPNSTLVFEIELLEIKR